MFVFGLQPFLTPTEKDRFIKEKSSWRGRSNILLNQRGLQHSYYTVHARICDDSYLLRRHIKVTGRTIEEYEWFRALLWDAMCHGRLITFDEFRPLYNKLLIETLAQ